MRLPQKPEEVFNFVRRAQEIQVQLGFAMESDDRNTVFWIERRGGRGGVRDNSRGQNARNGSASDVLSAVVTPSFRRRRLMSVPSCGSASGRTRVCGANLGDAGSWRPV